MSRSQRRDQRRQIASTPSFKVTESEHFRYVLSTGVFGGMAPIDCKILFFLDRLIPEMVPGGAPGEMRTKEINRELQVEVHMTPNRFKSLAEWMNANIARYEEQFGEIQKTIDDEKNPLVQ